MDLVKNGKLLQSLRKDKKMTQKEVADKLGVVPKTISKWETGKGFPDVSFISSLAQILGVNEKTLLNGSLSQNNKQSGNVKLTRFYFCKDCGSFLQGVGNCEIVCCGKVLLPLKEQEPDDMHTLTLTEIENDFYIELSHDMKKEHFISFISYVGFDRVTTLRLYPEQECAVRISKAYSGKILYYCNEHGLFKHLLNRRKS